MKEEGKLTDQDRQAFKTLHLYLGGVDEDNPYMAILSELSAKSGGLSESDIGKARSGVTSLVSSGLLDEVADEEVRWAAQHHNNRFNFGIDPSRFGKEPPFNRRTETPLQDQKLGIEYPEVNPERLTRPIPQRPQPQGMAQPTPAAGGMPTSGPGMTQPTAPGMQPGVQSVRPPITGELRSQGMSVEQATEEANKRAGMMQ